MESEILRTKLHEIIDKMDNKKVEAAYSLLTKEFETDSFRKQLIRYERDKFLRGIGESYGLDEMKWMAIHNSNRRAI